MDEQNNIVGARLYVRVSTDMQVDVGASIDSQISRMDDYCKYKNYKVLGIYKDEGISGAKVDRPELQRLLNDIQPNEKLIVAELSRLARNLAHSIEILAFLKEKGAHLVSLSPDIDFSTSIGGLFYNIIMSLNQYEREQISQRTSNVLQSLSKKKQLRAKPQYGWRFVDKETEFEPVPEQQKVIKLIIRLYNKKDNNGKKVNSINSIARTLNDKGLNSTLKYGPPRGDQIWYPEQIKNILIDHGCIKSNNRPPVSERFITSRRELKKEVK